MLPLHYTGLEDNIIPVLVQVSGFRASSPCSMRLINKLFIEYCEIRLGDYRAPIRKSWDHIGRMRSLNSRLLVYSE